MANQIARSIISIEYFVPIILDLVNVSSQFGIPDSALGLSALSSSRLQINWGV